MANSYKLLFLPLIILGMMSFIFSQTINANAIQGNMSVVTRAYPSYSNATYTDENTWYFAFGTFHYFADSITEFFNKLGAVGLLIGMFVFPIATLSSITILVVPYTVLYLMFGLGIYQSLNPLRGS